MKNNSRIKYLFILTITVLSGSFHLTHSQVLIDSLFVNKNSIQIDSIIISGNDLTEEFIIRRELTFNPGDTITLNDYIFNRERLYSLRLFSKVLFLIEEEKNLLNIQVTESWYIYPLPFLHLKEKSLKKSNFGFYLLVRNFRGRNETIRTFFSFGYDKYFTIIYENPSVFFQNDIGFSFSSSYSKFNNRSIKAEEAAGGNFIYDNFSLGIGVSKRFDQYNILTGFAGYQYLKAPVALNRVTASGKNIDRVSSFGAAYYYDSRDLKQFSESGMLTYISYNEKGLESKEVDYSILDYDLRFYKTITEDIFAKIRLAGRNSFRDVPFYDQSFLGYDYIVRGESDNEREDYNLFMYSLEISYPIIKSWNLSLDLPLIPKKLTSARIDLYLSSFFDSGTTFGQNKIISTDGYYYGYGLGLTILVLPYNAIRMEFALNKKGVGEFLFGTGFSF